MQNHIRNEFAYSEGRLRDFLCWGHGFAHCEPTFHEIIQQRITTKNHEIYELSSHVFAFGWLSGQAMQYTKRAVSKTLANACVFQRFVFFLGVSRGFVVFVSCCFACLSSAPWAAEKGEPSKTKAGSTKVENADTEPFVTEARRFYEEFACAIFLCRFESRFCFVSFFLILFSLPLSFAST